MAKFDLSSVAGVIHNGQQVNGVYLNGVLVADFTSTGEQVTYEQVALNDLATDDEVIIVFENRDDLSYWAMRNDEVTSAGPVVTQVSIDGNIGDQASISTNSENLNWVIEVYDGYYYFRTKDSDEYLQAGPDTNQGITISKSKSYINHLQWRCDDYLLSSYGHYLYVRSNYSDVKRATSITSNVQKTGKVYIFKRVIEV